MVSIAKINVWVHHQRELYCWFGLVLFGFSFGLISFYESWINAVECERSWSPPCSLYSILRNKYVRSQTSLSSPTESSSLQSPSKERKRHVWEALIKIALCNHCKLLGSILWRWLTHTLYCGNSTDISEKNIFVFRELKLGMMNPTKILNC